jgi:hypothetical protein
MTQIVDGEKLYTEEMVKELLDKQAAMFKSVKKVIWMCQPHNLSLRVHKIDATEDGLVIYVM